MNAESPTGKLAFAALMLLVLGLLWLQLATTGIGRYPLDDAYVVDHSVAGIRSGHESRFLDSTPWQGVTSPVYVATVVLLSFVLPADLAHWLVSALGMLLLASGSYVLGRRCSLGAPLAAGLALAGLLAGASFFQLSNGLETGLAMAALTWALVAFDQERPPTWGCILIGVLPFVRPELAALVLLYVFHLLRQRPAGHIRGLAITLATLLAGAALLLATSGTLAANTLSAKAYFFAQGCRPLVEKLGYGGFATRAFLADLGPFALGFALVAASRLRWIAFAFMAIFLLAYVERNPGALQHNYCRYLYLLLPLAVLGWAACLAHANQTLRIASRTLGVAAALAALAAAYGAVGLLRQELARFADDNAQMAEWVANNVPRDAVVLVHDAGRISLSGEQPLMDLMGLKSAFSTEVHQTTTYETCERAPIAIPIIARHAGASYLVVTVDWDAIFLLTDSLRFYGWTVERADTERGDSFYRVYRIRENRAL